MQFTKNSRRTKIHYRIRNKVKGTAERPRISVFRSNKFIYCQLIDDRTGRTLAAVSSKESSIDCTNTNKSEQARLVGKALAEKAIASNVSLAVFDRGGYLYHGRVKALAEGAREGGLQF